MTQMSTWEHFMAPSLRVLSDGNTWPRLDLFPAVGKAYGLTAEQMREALPSGQPRYANRIGWGLSFLTNVGAMERPARGHYAITQAGRRLLELYPQGFNERDVVALADDPNSGITAYEASIKSERSAGETTDEVSTLTPIEQVHSGVERIHSEVANELLQRLRGKEPAFFENAVIELLVAMGYGVPGGRASATKLSHDSGIDGIIDQDILGLSRVYVQAKRYAENNSVQRPDVQGFVGALHGKADGGIFITTSRFSDGALEFARSAHLRIVLIDGKRLAELMIRHGVGVQISETYHVVEVDEDFFS